MPCLPSHHWGLTLIGLLIPAWARMFGVVHHRIGSLLPVPGHSAEYAQLYIYDTENEVSNRLAAINTFRTGYVS
jgi:hypothetical protein